LESVRVTRWSEAQAPSEQHLRTLMQQENLAPYSWSNGAGDVYSPHSHPYDKVVYVAAGSIVWILPASGEEIETRRGDRLDLPRGVAHAARVGPQGVTCLEAHLQ
jgi:quercetin dioxygenase-like cupin family protein